MDTLKAYQKCLQLFREKCNKDHSALTAFNMANCYFDLENIDLAFKIHKEALQIWEELYGKASIHHRTASSHDSLGRVLLYTGNDVDRQEALTAPQ